PPPRFVRPCTARTEEPCQSGARRNCWGRRARWSRETARATTAWTAELPGRRRTRSGRGALGRLDLGEVLVPRGEQRAYVPARAPARIEGAEREHSGPGGGPRRAQQVHRVAPPRSLRRADVEPDLPQLAGGDVLQGGRDHGGCIAREARRQRRDRDARRQ